MPALLAHLSIWWFGPEWLALDEEKWPQSSFIVTNEDLPDRRSTPITTAIINKQESDIFKRYSKFAKFIQVIAYIFRFFDKVKQAKYSSKNSQNPLSSNHNLFQPISSDERHHAIQCLVRIIQTFHFTKEFQSFSNQGIINKNSPILKLNPFIDGFLRVGGRLKVSFLPYSVKHSLLLPDRYPLLYLIIKYEHERHFHAGPQTTLAAVRQNYWLISARDVVRQIIRKCVICFRSSPKISSTIMGNLPEPYVNIPSRSFEKCGIDYAGLLYYKDGIRKNAKINKMLHINFRLFCYKGSSY